MRLGVVMTGVGAHAAANAGVLRALEERGIEPFCVCGMQTGAWAAALYALGMKAEQMQAAIRQIKASGKRLLTPDVRARAMLLHGETALCSGKHIERLLLMQTGHRVLSLCEKPTIFPCRLVRNDQRIVFSTRPIDMDGALTVMQASVSFAARAAMAAPAILASLQYMGSPLLGESDAAFACQALMQLGAQRVMLIAPQTSAKKKPDVLELLAASLWGGMKAAAEEAHAGLLLMAMPENVSAADPASALLCEQAGYEAAREQLDIQLERMGMARNRILPFERRVTVHKY